MVKKMGSDTISILGYNKSTQLRGRKLKLTNSFCETKYLGDLGYQSKFVTQLAI